MKVLFIFVLTISISMGCTTVGASNAQHNAIEGALLGGIAGAVIGHQSGELKKGAAVGVAVGTVAGYMIGNEKDKSVHYNRGHPQHVHPRANQPRRVIDQRAVYHQRPAVVYQQVYRPRVVYEPVYRPIRVERRPYYGSYGRSYRHPRLRPLIEINVGVGPPRRYYRRW